MHVNAEKVTRIDHHQVAVYNVTMRDVRFPMRTECWMMGLHAVVLAAILAVPGSSVVCQLHSLLNQTSERQSVTASWHLTSDHLNATHLHLASSCHEDHEYRLTTPHRPPLFPKSWQAAVPLHNSSECLAGAGQANLTCLTVAGPAPPFLNQFPSRAPPLITRSRV